MLYKLVYYNAVRCFAIKFDLNYKMQAKQGKIQAQIDQIISLVHRNASEELRGNFHSYARKVFSSGPGRPNTDSTADLKQKITIRVTNTHDQRSVLQCQEITQRFLNNSTVHRKQEVLRMLLKLSEHNSRNEQDMSNVFREARKKELNYTIETNISNLTSFAVPQPRKPTQVMDQLKIVRNKGSAEDGVSETDLVRQLSFVFTNTSSSQIVETAQGYQLKNGLNVSDTVRRMVSELADLGWLHKRITKAGEKDGAVRRALKLAVQEELNEYYRWIGTMQNLAREGRLTLRKLQVWAFHPTELLKWLAIVLQAVEPFEGSHILSILNAYRPNGMAAVDGLLNRLLSHALQPLLNYIHRWTYRGQLLDPSNQFFISENRKVYESEQWQERFKLVAENVPSILDSESARMIFSTGKAIHFLLNRCKVLYQVKTPFLDTSCLSDTNALLSGPFRNWLAAVHGEVSQALVETLFNQFHLRHHLQSIKNFFLAGKGDFIQHLYDTLKDKLSLKKQEITEHSLDGYIYDAIGKCFPDFQLPDGGSFRSNIADRLLAKKIEFGSGNEGWDCFNFQYSLERIEPLQVFFSPETMLSYQKIFAFLWRVKQVEENLKGLWVLQSREEALRLRKTQSRELQSLFHLAYLLRSAMLHFLSSLHSYLMVTLQTAWSRFAGEASAARTLDDLLARHRSFQQEALEIALCTPREKNLQLALANIFSVIGNFKVVYLRLQENFDEYYQKLRLYEDRQMMARRGITVQSLDLPEISLGKSQKDLREVKAVFDTTFRNLFMQLRKEGEGRVSSLSVLAAKLDFSQYYTNLYLE